MDVRKTIRIILLGILGVFAGYSMTWATFSSQKKIVAIHYDKIVESEATYYSDRLNIFFIQDLVARLPNVARYLLASFHQAELVDGCVRMTCFEGYVETKIPRRFIPKFVQTKQNLLWNSYNFWLVGQPALQKLHSQ
jgi:hypothetical protein